MVEVEGVFHSQHLLRSDMIQDLQLVFGEFFEILFFLRANGGGAVDRGDFVEDLLTLFGRGLFECVEAEVHCLDYFVVGELSAHIGIGGSLNDCNRGKKISLK